MNERPEDVNRWVEYAESDLAAACSLACEELFARQAGFHAQQAAEKFLKAVLVLLEEAVPRSHDLAVLGERLSSAVPGLTGEAADLEWLTTFAVVVRYPVHESLATNTEHVERALSIARKIRDLCLQRISR